MDKILEPWPWYVSGPLIALIMMLLLLVGKRFGMSSNLAYPVFSMWSREGG